MRLIDTHVHIDYYNNPLDIAREYESSQIYTFFVTYLPEIFEKHLVNYTHFKYLRLCLGYHPQIVEDYDLDFKLFKSMSKFTHYIGEVGLDYKGLSSIMVKKQMKAFDYVTSPEINKHKIYTIHSRGTEDDIFNILENNDTQHVILHWYTGKLKTLDKFVDRGYFFSINPKMLNSLNGINIINRIPPEQLLFETDGPFSKINKKPIYPNHIEGLYKKIEETIPNFRHIAFKNFRRLLIQRDLK